MRVHVILLALFTNYVYFAQLGPIDFEPAGFGATWQWTTFENDFNPPLEIIANPDPSGINNSSTVARFTANVAGAPWAGFESLHGQGIGTFNLTAANCVVKIMVYKPIISPVGIKFATPAGASTGEILVSNTLINQWEELTFDFSAVVSAPSSTGIDQIIVFPDFTQRSDNRICLIDNIKFSNQNGGNPIPMGPAPTPTYPPSNVISLFSNPYQNVTVDTWMAPWSMAQVSDLQLSGNDTKRYDALNYVGVEFLANNQLDVTSMTHFRVDFWSPNLSTFKVKLVDFGPNGQYAGGDDSESELSYALPTEAWHTLEIPLSSFTSLAGLDHLSQLVFSGTPSGAGTVYIDNVLFFNNEGASIPEEQTHGVQAYPNPVSDNITLSTTEVPMNSIQVFGLDGTLLMEDSPNSKSYSINLSKVPTGTYLVRIFLANNTETLRIIKE
jgi:hypothetical protein